MAVVGDMLRAVSTFGPSPTSSFVDTDSTNQQHVHYTNVTWSVQMLEIQGAAKIHPRQKLLSILAKCQKYQRHWPDTRTDTRSDEAKTLYLSCSSTGCTRINSETLPYLTLRYRPMHFPLASETQHFLIFTFFGTPCFIGH